MIKLKDLSSGMTLILDDESKSVHGGDAFGALFGGAAAGFTTFGLGGNAADVTKSTVNGALGGSLFPGLNPLGAAASTVVGVGVGVGTVMDSSIPMVKTAPVNVPPVNAVPSAPITEPRTPTGPVSIGGPGAFSNFA